VRQHPNVHAAFQQLFPGGEDLVTSFGAIFFAPDGAKSVKRSTLSAHTDQNGNDVREAMAKHTIYQGVLYLWPTSEDGSSSSTVIWPGSHRKVFPEMMKDETFVRNGANGFHYSELSQMADAGRAKDHDTIGDIGRRKRLTYKTEHGLGKSVSLPEWLRGWTSDPLGGNSAWVRNSLYADGHLGRPCTSIWSKHG